MPGAEMAEVAFGGPGSAFRVVFTSCRAGRCCWLVFWRRAPTGDGDGDRDKDGEWHVQMQREAWDEAGALRAVRVAVEQALLARLQRSVEEGRCSLTASEVRVDTPGCAPSARVPWHEVFPE